MKVVIALGGNALAPQGGGDAAAQRSAVQQAVAAIADIARHHDVVVTHGNGPQVGQLVLQTEALGTGRWPLDALGAESEGLLGYWLEQDLENALPGRDVAALLTQVEVDPKDHAFEQPSKPIGPVLDEVGAARLRAAGLAVGQDRGGFRRLVASPHPHRIVEMRTLKLLLRLGTLVVCSGGGGIPVVRDADGARHGVDAVIDKDRTAALMATELGADHLLLLTDVPCVYRDWPERNEAIRRAPPHALVGLDLHPGTMGPKLEAARHFVQGSGGVATIGAVEEASALLEGRAGTRVDADASRLELASE
jgi:carbamate kinase